MPFTVDVHDVRTNLKALQTREKPSTGREGLSAEPTTGGPVACPEPPAQGHKALGLGPL